ncbi:MAG TPA: zinc-ribbon domain-containing protein [Terriglobales bacterium]|nr:zinc-ribbon domain-containing protein [Terriglobales bacterium]
MICPKCGEVNSGNFRFCGMCGTVLDGRGEPRVEARVEARRPSGSPLPGLVIPNDAGPSRRPVNAESAARAASPVATSISGPSISGPSMLGLNEPFASQSGLNQPSMNQPSMDSLREKAFSGLDSFFEPEKPKTSARSILLLVALLVALGGAGYWAYTNYLGAVEPRKTQSANTSPVDSPAETPSSQPAARDAAPESPAITNQPTTRRLAAPAVQPEPPAAAPAEKRSAKREPAVAAVKAASRPSPSVPPSTVPAPVVADTGDAAFRKGEAYLYGRGVPENCDEAVKNLKEASAKSNAKARSAFGTMYATGHCVPRDLPTSYQWFAMALHADPNNQILEKDLSAIWNQMTPPERQSATRMKQ